MRFGRSSTAIKKPVKAVLIVGKDQVIPDDLKRLYTKAGYLMIGDGTTDINMLDLSVLKDIVDNNTRVDIWAHGIVNNGNHNIDSGATKNFISKLSGYNPNTPLNLHISSCYAGAVAPDVMTMPEGSVLTAHGTPDEWTAVILNTETIKQSTQDLRIVDPIQDFIYRFSLNVKQTATISINRGNDTFKHTIRPPKHLLCNPDNIARYLEHERLEFIKAYDQDFGTRTDISKLPSITQKEAKNWSQSNIFYLIIANNKMLVQELKNRSAVIFPYITSQIKLFGSTPLILATQAGHVDLVKSILKLLDPFDVNQSFFGATALTIAVDMKKVDVVAALIASGKISELDTPVATYKTGYVRVRDLQGLDETRIKLLISDDAIATYNAGLATPQGLAKLDEAYITLSIKSELRGVNLLTHKELLIQDKLFINKLSNAIGQQLFQEGAEAKRQADVLLIKSTLLDVINDIKKKNPDFDVTSLDSGMLERGRFKKAKGSGLSEKFYSICSYTTAGYATGGIQLPQKNITQQFKDQLAASILDSQQQNRVQGPERFLHRDQPKPDGLSR